MAYLCRKPGVSDVSGDCQSQQPSKAHRRYSPSSKRYIASALAPITRSERVDTRRGDIFSRYDPNLQTFLDFVFSQYVRRGVGELDQEKLAALIQLKYRTIDDAASQLGSLRIIRDAFVGFQRYLYNSWCTLRKYGPNGDGDRS